MKARSNYLEVTDFVSAYAKMHLATDRFRDAIDSNKGVFKREDFKKLVKQLFKFDSGMTFTNQQATFHLVDMDLKTYQLRDPSMGRVKVLYDDLLIHQYGAQPSGLLTDLKVVNQPAFTCPNDVTPFPEMIDFIAKELLPSVIKLMGEAPSKPEIRVRKYVSDDKNIFNSKVLAFYYLTKDKKMRVAIIDCFVHSRIQ